MRVYKFGGASVKNARGVRNLLEIVKLAAADSDKLIVVVSAMGKTTNALERVAEAVMNHNKKTAVDELNEIRDYHYQIISELFPCGHAFLQQKVEQLLQEILNLINENIDKQPDADFLYDQIVSVGELISTRIVSYALDRNGLTNTYVCMPQILLTDDNYREAIPDMQQSKQRLSDFLARHPADIYVAQGFIGGTINGYRTTLGREGSDYTAALLANLTDANSVTIWKDVDGVLNADPRLVKNTVLLPQLNYYEAVELAYSGAQIIHPKTIRPLENKGIPLFVKPFESPLSNGTTINSTAKQIDGISVIIWRQNQVLITLRAKDFSFVLEDSLNDIFETIYRHHLKVSLIQSSAITISVCVDQSRHLNGAINELENKYKVTYNDSLQLLTIRGTNDKIIKECVGDKQILLSQTTRRTARFILKNK